MKKCPFCSESIQDDAMKCRFCGEWLEGGQAARPSGPRSIRDMVKAGTLTIDRNQLERCPGNLGNAMDQAIRQLGGESLLFSWHCCSGEGLAITDSHVVMAKAGMIGGMGTAFIVAHSSIQRIELKQKLGVMHLIIEGIDIQGKPLQYPYNDSSFVNNKERANYAIALLGLIRPLQGITPGSQQNLVASTLGTAAAVTAGIAAGSVIADLVTGPDTITTTIESVTAITDLASGATEVLSATETVTTTADAAGGFFDLLGNLFS